METAFLVARQTLVMFSYMLAGFLLFKGGKLTVKGSKDIATLLLWVIIPSVMINSFCVEFSMERLLLLAQSFLLGGVALFLSMLMGRLIFPKSPVDDFAVSFSNCGFIGIPLVQAALGESAVAYLVGIIALVNICQWTYGTRLLTGGKSSKGMKELIINPIVISLIIGILLFFTGLGTRLPSVITTTLSGFSALNAPVSMLILGVYLAQADMRVMFTNSRLYVLSAIRLLVIPAVTLLLFWALPFPSDIKMSIFIAASAPIGANVAVYSQLHGLDYPYACQTVTLCTLLSIIGLPLMIMLAGLVI